MKSTQTILVSAIVNNKDRVLLIRQISSALDDAQYIVEEMSRSIIFELYDNPTIQSTVITVKEARRNMLIAGIDKTDFFATAKIDVEYSYGNSRFKTNVSLWFYNCGKLDMDQIYILP